MNDNERETLLDAARNEIDRREELADSCGVPAFQDEGSAFIDGAEWAADFRRIEVPEPSAERLRARAHYSAPEAAASAQRYLDREPQGEPSDAQVLAAIAAFHQHPGDYIERSSASWQRGRMRAALRAASAVTDQEEHKIVPWSRTGRMDSPVSCQTCGRSLFLDERLQWTHVPPAVTEQGEGSHG